MRRGPRFNALLESAKRRTSLISFEEGEDGKIEVLWLRRHLPYLASVMTFTSDKPEFCLLAVIAQEDAFVLRKDHGDGCPCEDCCIARVDQERLSRPS